MRRFFGPFILAFVVSACDNPQPGPRIVTIVEGYRINVQQDLRDGGNGWFASHALGQGVGGTQPEQYARNIVAIETVSGCKVDVRTIYNNPYGYTTAAVRC